GRRHRRAVPVGLSGDVSTARAQSLIAQTRSFSSLAVSLFHRLDGDAWWHLTCGRSRHSIDLAERCTISVSRSHHLFDLLCHLCHPPWARAYPASRDSPVGTDERQSFRARAIPAAAALRQVQR